jgi:tetratricopeptide (TPR) repeat protein
VTKSEDSSQGDRGLTRPSAETAIGLMGASPKVKRSCIYQQQEYDEGMYAYSEALPLHDGLGDYIRSATLLYDVGQTHVRRGQYNEARQWFDLAMVRVKLAPSDPTASITTVKIHHNLGHCFYGLGQNTDTISSFRSALVEAQNAQFGDLHAAAASNAIAVLLFRGESLDMVEAIKCFKGSLSVYEQMCWGWESKEVATIMNTIGRVHFLNGDYNEALSAKRRILANSLSSFGM